MTPLLHTFTKVNVGNREQEEQDREADEDEISHIKTQSIANGRKRKEGVKS